MGEEGEKQEINRDCCVCVSVSVNEEGEEAERENGSLCSSNTEL